MLGAPKTNEWKPLKDQLDLLVAGEDVREDNIEKLFDNQIRHRFGEWISWAVEGRTKTDN